MEFDRGEENHMDPVLEEAAAYFKRQPGFERALQKLWEKWRSYGRFAGIVDLGSPQKDEKKALEGLFGVGLVRNGKLRFHSADFEEALSKTRFSSVSLKQLLEAYYGATLISKKDDEEKLLEEKKKLYGQALRIVSENNAPTGTALLLEEKTKEAGTFPISVRWLNSLSMQKLWQMKQNASSDAECLSQVSKIGKALTLLEQTDPQKGIRLAVLAMEARRWGGICLEHCPFSSAKLRNFPPGFLPRMPWSVMYGRGSGLTIFPASQRFTGFYWRMKTGSSLFTKRWQKGRSRCLSVC